MLTARKIMAVSGLLVASTAANAQLSLDLVGEIGSSIVSYEYSGSTTLTASPFGFAAPGLFADVGSGTPFNFDSFNTYEPLTGSLTVTNETDSSSLNGTSLILGETVQGVDRFGIESSGALNTLPFAVGDTMSWAGSGTIDLASVGLTFTDLNVGTYQSSGFSDLFGSHEYEAVLTIRQIPAPGTAAFLCMSSVALVRGRRR